MNIPTEAYDDIEHIVQERITWLCIEGYDILTAEGIVRLDI